MSADSSIRPSLSSLRREAKSLLDEVRRNQSRRRWPWSGNTIRTRRISPATATPCWWLPGNTDIPAGEELQRTFEEEAGAGGTLEERADLFAELACLSYRGDDHVSRRERAARMLAETPGISGASPWAAAAAFDVEALGQLTRGCRKRRRPPGGPRDWPPLLYLCFSRVPEDSGPGATPWLPLSCCWPPAPGAAPASGRRNGAAGAGRP